MMRKLLFTAYWTAEEAEGVMTFLDELKETIAQNYETKLRALYHAESELNAKSEEQMTIDFKEEAPF